MKIILLAFLLIILAIGGCQAQYEYDKAVNEKTPVYSEKLVIYTNCEDNIICYSSLEGLSCFNDINLTKKYCK